MSRISQAQLLALRLGQLKNEGKMHFAQVSLAKQNNVEMALEVARTCRDMLGGNGIMIEYKTMRHMCNLETVYTYEGTNEYSPSDRWFGDHRASGLLEDNREQVDCHLVGFWGIRTSRDRFDGV